MADESMEFLKQSIASHDRHIGELTDRLAEVSDHIDSLTANVQALTTNMHTLVEVTNQDATSIRQLAAIAQRHEERLDNLDGGQ